jgi:hypothetical protein
LADAKAFFKAAISSVAGVKFIDVLDQITSQKVPKTPSQNKNF